MMGHDQGENWDQGYKAWEKAQAKTNDPLTRLSQEAIERRMRNTPVLILGESLGMSVEELKKLMNQPMPIICSEPFEIEHLDLDYLKHELEAASNYIAENEVIHKKFKKNIPTVIEYQGRRYILDNGKR